MLGYLWAATALSAVLATLSLALGLLLARRYRQLHGALANMLDPGDADSTPEPGMKVPDFAVTADDGQLLGPADLAHSNVLIAFLSAGCPPCEEELPALREACITAPEGQPTAIAVVTGESEKQEHYVEAIRPFARIVTGSAADEIATAFGVHGFPRFVLAGQGELRQVGRQVHDIDENARQPEAPLESMS